MEATGKPRVPVDGVEVPAGAISDPVISGESGDVVPRTATCRDDECQELAVATVLWSHFTYNARGGLTMPAEKALDRALEIALRDDQDFRKWFVNKTKFKGDNPRRVWSRSDNPWCGVKLRLPNRQTGEPEVVTRQGETDVLFVFVFEAEPGRRLALHIENKLASGRFTPFQPEVYAARAEFWTHNPSYGNYDEWDTVLLAPLSFRDRHAAIAQRFGTFIAHEDVAQYVPSFRHDEGRGK